MTLTTPSIRWAGWIVLTALAYYASGRAGLLMSFPGSTSSLLWPPAGIALAAMIRLGPRLWPAMWIGSFALAMSMGEDLGFASTWATVHAGAPLLAAAWLARCGFRVGLQRRRDLALLALAGVIAATLIAAGCAATTLAFGSGFAGGPSPTPMSWLHRWLGDALGAVAFGVPLVAWSRASVSRAIDPAHRVPTLLLLTAAAASGWLAASSGAIPGELLAPVLLLPHLVLATLVVRSGLFAGSLAAALVALVALAAASGHVPFSMPGAAPVPSWIWGYVWTLVLVPMLTSALLAGIASRHALWKRALDISRTGLAELDARSGKLAVTPRWKALLGGDGPDAEESMAALWDRIHPDDVARLTRSIERLRRSPAQDICARCRVLTSDGQWQGFELRGFAIDPESLDDPPRMVFLGRDDAERQSASSLRRLSQSLVRNLDDGLLITDAQGRVLQANPAYCRLTGHAEQQLLGTVPDLLGQAAVSESPSDLAPRVRRALAADDVWRGEVTLKRRDGETHTLRATVSVVRDDDGRVQNHVLAFADVTQSHQQMAQLQRQAHFDDLTGLPNRVRLTQLLTEALASCRRDGSMLTVCLLDLDHFKRVNDEFGPLAGDRLLQQLAERLRRTLRASASGDDVAARFGGDEFVLLLRVASVEEGRLAVERMRQVVSLPFSLSAGQAPVVVTASVGATMFPSDNADAETLLRHAHQAMYGAKQAGGGGCHFFDAERSRLAEARFVEIGRMQEALDGEELCLYFQPKVDMRDGSVLGVEALLRWNHPEQGLLTPDHFLPLIEHTRLGSAVGDWVLRKGVEQLSRWQRQGLDLTVSINISARHLQDPDFARNLAALLSRQPTPVADRLVLEVLETTALADIEFTCGVMDACRALGVRFALDDFGTGYSTLTYLKRLPLDMLKIDRSFVTHMLRDRQDMAIVEGVIGLSQTFGCAVVAEGVETLEQAQALIELGCDIGQGNGIAPAMPTDDVVGWVRNFGGMSTLAAPLLP